MIKFGCTEVMGWEAAIRGIRNSMNSCEKSDSFTCETCRNNIPGYDITMREECGGCCSWNNKYESDGTLKLGLNDLDLMKRLRNSGTDHRKFMRMIVVYVDITAPLYWWNEFKTYRAGRKFGDEEPDILPIPDDYLEYDIEMNSCSTIHKIADKEFTLEDFSYEHLMSVSPDRGYEVPKVDLSPMKDKSVLFSPYGMMHNTIRMLNICRQKFIETKNKNYWWQMIQLLPSSYNQKRTVMLNYEVLANIYKSRRNHKLDEWSWHEGIIDGDKTNKEYIGFCDWIETLPYSELITCEHKKEE